MPRRARPHRLAVRLTGGEHDEVSRRARAHGVPMAEFMRRSALSGVAGPAGSDDDWFLSLPPERKAQVRGWLDKSPAPPPSEVGLPLPLDL